jgi:hypothetical protein
LPLDRRLRLSRFAVEIFAAVCATNELCEIVLDEQGLPDFP